MLRDSLPYVFLSVVSAWLLGFSVVRAALGTTPNFQEIFEGRCYEYSLARTLASVDANCTHLYDLFQDAFAFQPSCGLNSSRYEPFIRAAQQEVPVNKSLFWSGTYSAVRRLSRQGRDFTTLEDSLIGYLADRLTWCGSNTSTGIDYDECPDWDSCNLESSESFWVASSSWFARSSRGEAYVLLSGSNPQRKAFKQDSFFGGIELPNVDPTRVTKLNVLLMYELGQPRRETCTTGSLIQLRQLVTSKGIEFDCKENPAAVFHLLCSENPGHDECQDYRGNGAAKQALGLTSFIFVSVFCTLFITL